MENQGKEFDVILQECLDALLSGQATLDSLLGLHPEIAEELRPHLEAALWLSQRKAALDLRPGYLQASRSRLLSRIRQEAAHDARPARRQPGVLEGMFQALFGRVKLAQALAAFVLVTCLVAASGGSLAWAAGGSVPGDRLYSVKKAFEAARLALTFSDYGDADLHLTFAEERAEELDTLVNLGRVEALEATVEEYNGQVDSGLALLDEITTEDAAHAKGLAEKYARQLEAQHGLLTAAAHAAPGPAAAHLQRAIQASEQAQLTVQNVLKNTNNGKSGKDEATLTATTTATASPSAIAPTATWTPEPSPTGTPEATLQSSLEDETKKPHPTRKPTKTPNENLPDPTRRPPKPTKKP